MKSRGGLQTYYQELFEDILERINARRPGLADSAIVRPRHALPFDAGIYRIKYVWSFPGGDKNFCVELEISTGSKERNQLYFDRLYNQKEELADELGAELVWIPLNKKGVCYVRLESEWDNTTTGRQLETLKEWAVDRMLIFYDTLQPRIEELSLE
jgi:hypothetical protein